MNHQLGISLHNVGLDYIVEHNFKRIQLCHKFSGAKEITSLLKFARKYPINVIYHAPVFYQVDPTATYYLNSNSRLRKATFEILETNLKMAKNLPTEYVVIHFTSKDVDEKMDCTETKSLAQHSAKRLDELAAKYNTEICLEYSGYNNMFCNPKDWIDVLESCKNMGICLDVGHFYIACKEYGLNYFRELSKMLPYIEMLHLWNTRGKIDIMEHGHIPVHPSQRAEDGWIDIERTLNLVLGYNIDIPIVFEPDFTYGDKKYAQEGINWVNDIISSMTNLEYTSDVVKS